MLLTWCRNLSFAFSHCPHVLLVSDIFNISPRRAKNCPPKFPYVCAVGNLSPSGPWRPMTRRASGADKPLGGARADPVMNANKFFRSSWDSSLWTMSQNQRTAGEVLVYLERFSGLRGRFFQTISRLIV